MLADDRPKVREEAVCKIEETRSRCSESGVVREFRVPNIHFQAKDYHHLVDWKKTPPVREPPFTSKMTQKDLEMVKMVPIDSPDLPCHSQGVERWVSEVTHASAKKAGHDGRHRFILSRSASRRCLPRVEQKGDFFKWASSE